MLATNSIEFIVIYLAVIHAGHIVMPIDPVYKKLEVDAIINGLSPSMIVLQERYKDQVGEHEIPTRLAAELLNIKDHAAVKRPWRLPADEQVASITFTSGTSGTPKAVPNTHANHLWSIKVCSQAWEWSPKDTLLICLPLSHWYGLVMGLSGAIYHGNTLYLRQQSFEAKNVLKELASGKISLFTHAPIAYARLLEEPGDYDLSNVRLMISGSAPLPPKVWQDFKDRFGAEVIETYGSSETGRIAANLPGQIKLGSPGRLLAGVNAKVTSQGEIAVSSGGLFPGYWRNSPATKAALTSDGFWRTGDIGEIKDGYVYLKGRVQERIRKFGYTVSPRDVEWALLKNPAIKEVLVVGAQQSGRPDDLINYFVCGQLSESDIRDYCKQNLPFSWRPDNIFILDSLPRTRNGKPDLGALKEMAAK